MIEYQNGVILFNLLFKAHGSAVYRAMIPGTLSVMIYLLIDLYWQPADEGDDRQLRHPYGIGVLVSSISFLIIFRANYGYQRYWEACTAVHHCLSKWLDATIHTGQFHLQCKHYNGIKPPTFFDNHELDRYKLTREREHKSDFAPTTREEKKSLRHRRRVIRSIEFVQDSKKRQSAFDAQETLHRSMSLRDTTKFDPTSIYESNIASLGNIPVNRLTGPPRLDGGWGLLFQDDVRAPTATFFGEGDEQRFLHEKVIKEGFASSKGGRTPSLFLQELAHLASLCAAVALSTLRNDVPGECSPLGIYEPGQPWPEADPDNLPKETQREFIPNWFWKNIKYALLLDRGAEERTRYNTARPMLVIGGVSDNEIAFLQKARGPSAKTTLAWSWLSEFIIREQLAGSLGAVGPPIISRIFQFLSDGMIFYNHARKVMYIPFPFPHAQLSAFFIVSIIFTVPFLMNQYTGEAWLGAVLTFLTVTCLAGMHEVARELENPFRNAPNDVPLCTLLAFFNESLITMYSGYHPDLYWNPTEYERLGDGVRMGKPLDDDDDDDEVEKEPEDLPKQKELPVTIDAQQNENKVETLHHPQAAVPGNNPQSWLDPEVIPSDNADILREMQEKMAIQEAEIQRLRTMIENPGTRRR